MSCTVTLCLQRLYEYLQNDVAYVHTLSRHFNANILQKANHVAKTQYMKYADIVQKFWFHCVEIAALFIHSPPSRKKCRCPKHYGAHCTSLDASSAQRMVHKSISNTYCPTPGEIQWEAMDRSPSVCLFVTQQHYVSATKPL